jgi:hypothetical protein
MDLYSRKLARFHRPTPSPKKLTYQLLDTGIDVGAVKSGDAGLNIALHILQCRGLVDRTMAPGQLPATLYDSRD